MRSRYTAYVVHETDYLLKSWHPLTRPSGIDPETVPEWCKLHIIRTDAGSEQDEQGMVEFRATALSGTKVITLHEISRFVKEDDRWFYVDGDVLDNTPSAAAPLQKTGRNAPCPCGSGKKYKKCCGP